MTIIHASFSTESSRRGSDLGLEIEIVEFEQTTRSAQEAADTIGCDVAQIVKSLCFVVNGRSVICLVSGVNQLDECKLVALAGLGRKKVKIS